jgi:glycerol dehydrogenase
MSKIICSPGSYVQGNGELGRLAQYVEPFGKGGAYMIVDSFINNTYHDLIVSSFEEKAVAYSVNVFGGECCMKEIDKHKAQLGEASVVVGIGGGKTLDTAKAVAHYSGLSVIIVPTAASTDAPCSRLSVIYTESGEFEKYLPLPKNPEMVLMDTEIIAKAPVRFLVAGIGDALATYYEAVACVKSDAVTMAGGHVTNAAITLAKLCRDILLEDGVKAVTAVTPTDVFAAMKTADRLAME